MLGPALHQFQEIYIRNRVVRWTDAGIGRKADQRHAENVVREMGLEGAKAAPTAGTREEQKVGSVPVAALKVEIEDESFEAAPETQARPAESPRVAIILFRTG